MFALGGVVDTDGARGREARASGRWGKEKPRSASGGVGETRKKTNRIGSRGAAGSATPPYNGTQ
ncbi:MAG: hypothetical protein RLZZ15_918 [Verrucomicrobiota bacterium]|jgi:hypothetical protein